MDHHAATPPDGEEHKHEMTDIAVKPIIYFLIGLVIFGGLVQGAMSLVMRGYITQDTKIATLPSDVLRDSGDVNRPPALQKNTTRDMLRMYEQEDEILNTYQVDPKTKEIRVPLDRAMEIVARKGLPHRADGPKIDKQNLLPYPPRSKAYQATP